MLAEINTKEVSAVTTRTAKAPHETAKRRAFGIRLEEALNSMRLSQADFGKLMGVSRSSVNLWITGQTYPSLDNIEKCAKILKVSASWLAFNEGSWKTASSGKASIPVVDLNGQKYGEVGRVILPHNFLYGVAEDISSDLQGVLIEGLGNSIALVDVSAKEIGIHPKPMVLKIDGVCDVYQASRSQKDDGVIVVESRRGQHEVHNHPGMVIGTLRLSMDLRKK